MVRDGPGTDLFRVVELQGQVNLSDLHRAGLSTGMADAVDDAPSGECVCWGIPFAVNEVIVVQDRVVSASIAPIRARWLVLMHTSDRRRLAANADGFFTPMRGQGQLGEHAADYVFLYEDGVQERVAIRRRHHIGAFQRRWGENCFEAVAHRKPHPVRASHEQLRRGWGQTQTRVASADNGRWVNWLWAWQNPRPDKAIVGVRFEPVSGLIVVSAISAGDVASLPLRWQTRRKALFYLPEGESFCPDLDEYGNLQQVQLDMGVVISAQPRLLYPNERWAKTYNNQLPERSAREIVIEYTAHPDARFHLVGARTMSERTIPVSAVESAQVGDDVRPISPATQRVTFKVVSKETGKPVAVKLHVHGEAGEYLAPVDRQRIPNPAWFEDYSVDFSHRRVHFCTYISGETTIDLPLGQVYVEVSKGFEVRPVRRVLSVTQETTELVIELEKVLPWREKGWVTADTHVHFLTPMSALLEGAAEGVNVVNLLASQWGELMTNVGDFDGRTTWGSKEAGGDGEYLVRVGTENRQHVLGHISLLGYRGKIIAPMTTGGTDESALGDPIAVLLTEWARQCHRQGGLVVLPHFPNPRAEHAASIVGGDIDALEMTSWGNLYGGIDPYSLADWYRYLNCGYLVAAVGGTDKMSAEMAVGTVRTYARLAAGEPFTYRAWMQAVQRAETFVTYGPLLDLAVDGRPMGSQITIKADGGTVDVTWQVSSATLPMSRVALVVNGEIRESLAVAPDRDGGHWSVKIAQSSWLALLVRGHCPGAPVAEQSEIIAAHSTPVMVRLDGSPMLAAADAVTILEQIEGAMAYLDTVGTRKDDVTYKRMRLALESAHRRLHNRMHRRGYYHDHTLATDHAEHH